MTPDTVMIFAAGLGTRMGELTRHRPKPMIEVAGRPLIDHALALTTGLARIVVNTHAHADQIRDHLGDTVLISHEPERLETGGGLRNALPLLGQGPVFTLNADMVWTGNPLLELARHWDPARMDALLCLVPRDAAVGHAGSGDFDRAPDGRLARGSACVYTGAQIIKTDTIATHPERIFSLNAIWDPMIAAGRLFGIPHHGTWVDVGRPEGIALAEAELAR